MTSNNLLGVKLVTMDGQILEIGGLLLILMVLIFCLSFVVQRVNWAS